MVLLPVAKQKERKEIIMEGDKKVYSAQEAKKAFMLSMYNYLQNTLQERDVPNFFTIEGSSIFVDLPENFFTMYEIPKGMRIEMKFVAKK